jgi:phage terminase large subunit-like protein
MKIRSAGAQLFPADGQTYIRKLTVAFRNFAKAPKNDIHIGTSTTTKTIIIIIIIIIIIRTVSPGVVARPRNANLQKTSDFSVVLHKKSLSFSRLQSFKGFKTKNNYTNRNFVRFPMISRWGGGGQYTAPPKT